MSQSAVEKQIILLKDNSIFASSVQTKGHRWNNNTHADWSPRGKPYLPGKYTKLISLRHSSCCIPPSFTSRAGIKCTWNKKGGNWRSSTSNRKQLLIPQVLLSIICSLNLNKYTLHHSSRMYYGKGLTMCGKLTPSVNAALPSSDWSLSKAYGQLGMSSLSCLQQEINQWASMCI